MVEDSTVASEREPQAPRAAGLLSSGLDSALALRLVSDQGVKVIAVHIVLPFGREKQDYPGLIAANLGVDLLSREAGEEYIEVLRSPRHGYGSHMNPCIDCRVYMLTQAWQVATEVGADFLVTGDVLGQRPMTQHGRTLRLEDREAGLEGLVLRPLSARLLPQTIPEQEGWVKRERLLALKGKTRKPQLALAHELGIQGYRPASGGCPLTHAEFASKVQQLLARRERITKNDLELLQVGRHFYDGATQIVVGRDRDDNAALRGLMQPEDCVLEVPHCGSPVTLVRGPKERQALETAARLTARYSDARDEIIQVECRAQEGILSIVVRQEDGPDNVCQG